MLQRHQPDRGASSVEYGLIVFAIASVIVAILFAFGRVTDAVYDESCDTISNQALAEDC